MEDDPEGLGSWSGGGIAHGWEKEGQENEENPVELKLEVRTMLAKRDVRLGEGNEPCSIRELVQGG